MLDAGQDRAEFEEASGGRELKNRWLKKNTAGK